MSLISGCLSKRRARAIAGAPPLTSNTLLDFQCTKTFNVPKILIFHSR